ncbi:MAG: nucleotidyltransferase family protein [Paraglaciecola sp.]|uniref:nucleotidyltransferase family protein n=1 Tax=Paraglaciecola sp. TaxID=1920173 RepID=UPI00273DC192|nr:nucleotidyltransferase family protein [Paraglaciecola sp.]MDP5029397.1 nucleotidyltransferase family protein [Paraglaciecola sp.]MDP5132985.1 nucleotidyltransferase family protein [Paraglaciecola sp.]
MTLHTVILAAGSSQRFFGIKQLAEIKGLSLLEHTINCYKTALGYLAQRAAFTIVVGANQNKIIAAVGQHIECYYAPNWSLGMGHSLADFIKNVAPTSTHVLVGLADQIALQSEDIQRLIKVHQEFPEAIISARYNNVVGAPCIFPRSYYIHLSELRGDKGAKSVLEHFANHVVTVDIPNAQFDVDTPEDFKKAKSLAQFKA